jgi:Flp pilus assembly protein TadD
MAEMTEAGGSGVEMGGKREQSALAGATAAREAGRLDEARRRYRQVLTRAPDEPEALHWLGVLEHLEGRDGEARELLERAAARAPEDAQLRFHLGEVLRRLGCFEAAIDHYRAAGCRVAGIADLHFGLGAALLAVGRSGEARVELTSALALAPEDAEIHEALAGTLAAEGEATAAERHFERALALRPDFAEARVNLALLQAENGQPERAEAGLIAALALDSTRRATWQAVARLLGARLAALAEACPQVPWGWVMLAEALRGEERYEAAAALYRRVLADHPDLADLAEVHNDLGQCLINLERLEEGLAHFRDALRIDPTLAAAHFNMGVALQTQGRFAEAMAAHEQALALAPQLTEAHYNLALMRGASAGVEDARRLREGLARPGLDDAGKVHLHFALGRLHDARGEVAEAFGHYRAGNALKARGRQFDGARHSDFVDQQIATFDDAFFACRRDFGGDSELPVLIVGMPRSGTSLVEQILASHPELGGAGELNALRDQIRGLPALLGSDEPYPRCVEGLTAPQADELAEAYMEILRAYGPGASRVTDKMPGNYLRLGLLALILPKARILHCRRDPRDTCLSCYFHDFAHGLSFAYDLANLGLVYRAHDRLMSHWRRVLPNPILEVGYEALVEDTEGVTREILAFCDLPWDARCLDFHRTRRSVRTASFWQVRQPIYRQAIGRWRDYRDYLGELFDALEDMDGEQR